MVGVVRTAEVVGCLDSVVGVEGEVRRESKNVTSSTGTCSKGCR